MSESKTSESMQHGVVFSPQSGKVARIEEMPDQIISEKTLGDGVCIVPSERKIYSPVDGKVGLIADTKHAMVIIADDGAEIMLHIGVDTVELRGSCFEITVETGQRIHAGDLICEADIQGIITAGYYTHTAVLITNTDSFEISDINYGEALAGETPLFRYYKK